MTKKERFIQILKFTAFSISAGVIQIVSYELLALLCGIWFTPEQFYWWVYIISLSLSVLWNFTFNRKFTFKSAVNVPFAMFLVACYYLVFTPLSSWWGDALVKIGWNDTLVVVMNMIINFATEYLYDTFVVFRKPSSKSKTQIRLSMDEEDFDDYEEDEDCDDEYEDCDDEYEEDGDFESEDFEEDEELEESYEEDEENEEYSGGFGSADYYEDCEDDEDFDDSDYEDIDDDEEY